ncbi:MAG: leucine-rich repeat protein [Clostridia bacterium]|nr:leucine-rich repeat protein [Clostridia bacterium]
MKKTNKLLLTLLLVALAASLLAVGFTAAAEEPTYAVNDRIQFGSYPQTQVEETEELAAAAAATWKSYGYYSGTGTAGTMEQSDYMQFADFFCGGEKYRAVYFTAYRPDMTYIASAPERSMQDESGYETGTTYYFRYEPLVWRVLDPDTGYIMCDALIDAQAYQNTVYYEYYYSPSVCSEPYQDEALTIYANNYATCSLRDWLNGQFFETAFTPEQKANIQTTALNNDSHVNALEPRPEYNSAATNDKIFLISWDDALNADYGFDCRVSSTAGYSVSETMQGTDYARSQGLYRENSSTFDGCAWRWLRNPGCTGAACVVNMWGEMKDFYEVDMTLGGVAPACRLSELGNNAAVSRALYSADVVDWGYCGGEGDGTNLTWVLDSEGTLTISGSGYARNGAFQGRTDVKNVVFLDGTDYIGGNMFAGCSNLESITIPHSSMEEIEVTAFADCDSLSVIYYDGTPAQWDLMTIYYHAENLGGSYTEYAQTMRAYIKSLVQFADTDWGYCGGEGDGTNLMWELSTDYTLTISGTGEMANYTSYQSRTTAPWGPYYLRLKTVVLQPGVTSIGDSAFYDCTSLESVTIPDGVLSIGNHSFVGCFALTSVTIPDGVTSIPPSAFATCLALTSVMIPDSVTSIDAGAFSYCTALQDVYYGGSEAQWGEIQIDESGEYGNESLLNANIHYNVVDWGYCGAADNEESLTWVFTNDGTLTISGTGPMGAFRQNGHYVMIGVVGPTAKRVRKVVVEEGVTSLPEQAFIGVDRYLEEVILPASLETIGAWAFYHLEGLRSVTIPENSQLTTIGSAAFSGDSSLTSFRIPEGVTTIENGAFYQVPLTELTIPGSVTTIGNAAFDGGYSDEQAVFTTVTIPATVTSIGSNAFRKAVVIYGYAGSAAEAFAAENGNVFIALCPTEHQNAYEVPATEATEAAHGYTAGVFCPDCETWLSGHDVIHNALGEQRVIKEPTETEEGIVDIRCTVCGEWGRYTADPTGSQPDDNSGGFWAQIQSFFRGIIDWFLRLFKWLGK